MTEMVTVLTVLGVLIVLGVLVVEERRNRQRREAADKLGALCYDQSRAREAWKSYALALEVVIECHGEYSVDVPGEGCRTRGRRREKILGQLYNAEAAGDAAFDELLRLGEYEC